MRGCSNFKPLLVNTTMHLGAKQMELHRYKLKDESKEYDYDGIFELDENGNPIEIGGDGEPLEYDEKGNVLNPMPIEVICANEGDKPKEEQNTLIELNASSVTSIPLNFPPRRLKWEAIPHSLLRH